MNMLSNINRTQTFTIINIGDCAYDRLQRNIKAQVVGATSKGIFLQDTQGKIVFITCEKYRGPLTLNLSGRYKLRDVFTIGDCCQSDGRYLQFPKCDILIQNKVSIWRPPPIKFTNSTFDDAKERCLILAKKLIETYDNSIFIPFLNAIAKRPNDNSVAGNEWIIEAYRLLPGINEADIMGMSEIIPGLIGYGPGLTPSGDDFICGYALASFYLSKLTNFSIGKHELVINHKQSLDKQTTNLSAQIIHCAIMGKADERLTNSLRWVAHGGPGIENIKEELLTYGSSSGIDSYAGILSAMIPA